MSFPIVNMIASQAENRTAQLSHSQTCTKWCTQNHAKIDKAAAPIHGREVPLLTFIYPGFEQVPRKTARFLQRRRPAHSPGPTPEPAEETSSEVGRACSPSVIPGYSRLLCSILWMDEILHYLRNPGMMIPLQISTNNGFPWFPSGAGFRTSAVRSPQREDILCISINPLKHRPYSKHVGLVDIDPAC